MFNRGRIWTPRIGIRTSYESRVHVAFSTGRGKGLPEIGGASCCLLSLKPISCNLKGWYIAISPNYALGDKQFNYTYKMVLYVR